MFFCRGLFVVVSSWSQSLEGLMGLADRDYMRTDHRQHSRRPAGVSWLARLRFWLWQIWRKITRK
jgi:hypothetical protein